MNQLLPPELVHHVEHSLRFICGRGTEIITYKRLSGGSVNEALRLDTTSGSFFLKWNTKASYPEMFRKEANGLNLLKKAEALHVPGLIFSEETNHYQYLILEMVQSNGAAWDYGENLGRGLGLLHRTFSATAGLDESNYIGSLAQSNEKNNSWIKFYLEERLWKQLSIAEKAGVSDDRLKSDFEKLFIRLPQLIPEEKHSLLHGDLWSGNVISNREGQAVIIDPAVYFGHREVDLAMTRLFGGFDSRFYSAYKETFPLESGSDERIGLYQLYPLLVHLNLFGKTYLSQIRTVISKYL